MSNTWRWLKPAPGELSGAVHQMERELSKEYGRETGTGFTRDRESCPGGTPTGIASIGPARRR